MGNCFIYGQSGGGTSPYYPFFANNDWEAIIDACKRNKVPSTWVADGTCYKDMEINGTNYRIDIIGKNHDTYAEGGTAPLTFQMHDCYQTTYAMDTSSNNSWRNSAMRNTYLPAITNQMPNEVETAIREVQKKTSAGDMSSTIVTTNDKLFLLSEIEVFGSAINSYAGEGEQYEYYQLGNSKVKSWGRGSIWWERSPWTDSSYSFCLVDNSGTANAAAGNFVYGVAFAFCF